MPIAAPCGGLQHSRAQTFKVFYLVMSLIDANSMLCPWVKLLLAPTILTSQGTPRPPWITSWSTLRPLPGIDTFLEVLESSDLKTSDYLALSVSLSCDIPTQFANNPNWIRIDWAKAKKFRALLNFQKEVCDRLKPFTQKSRGNVDHINREIGNVAWLITDAAHKTLPLLKSRPTDSGTGHYHNCVQKANMNFERYGWWESILAQRCNFWFLQDMQSWSMYISQC